MVVPSMDLRYLSKRLSFWTEVSWSSEGCNYEVLIEYGTSSSYSCSNLYMPLKEALFTNLLSPYMKVLK